MNNREYQAIVACAAIGLSFGLSGRRVDDFLERYDPSASFRLLDKGGERLACAWLIDSKYLDRVDDALVMARRAAIAGFITAVLMGMNLPAQVPSEELEHWAGQLVRATRRIETADPIVVIWSWYSRMIDNDVQGCSFFTLDLDPEHPCSNMMEGAAELLQHPEPKHTDLSTTACALKEAAKFASRADGHALNATAHLLESISIFLQIQSMQQVKDKEAVANQVLTIWKLMRSTVQEMAKAAAAWYAERLHEVGESASSLLELQEQQSKLCKDMSGMFCEVMLNHKLPQLFGVAGAN